MTAYTKVEVMRSSQLDDNGDIVIQAVHHTIDGHFKFHYEIMLNCKLATAEIVSSPLDSNGENPCVRNL